MQSSPFPRYLLTYILTHSTVQSPSWAANCFAASQEIPRISRNPKVHYRTHNRPPPVSILRQPNPVHIPTSHLLQIHPNIIHPSTPRSPQWSLSSGFRTKTLYTPLSSSIRATCPAHLILLHFMTRTILGEQYKSFSSSLCNLLHSLWEIALRPNITTCLTYSFWWAILTLRISGDAPCFTLMRALFLLTGCSFFPHKMRVMKANNDEVSVCVHEFSPWELNNLEFILISVITSRL